MKLHINLVFSSLCINKERDVFLMGVIEGHAQIASAPSIGFPRRRTWHSVEREKMNGRLRHR
jgi:hypothetical protein